MKLSDLLKTFVDENKLDKKRPGPGKNSRYLEQSDGAGHREIHHEHQTEERGALRPTQLIGTSRGTELWQRKDHQDPERGNGKRAHSQTRTAIN